MLTPYELSVLRRYIDVATVCNTPGSDCTGCPDFQPGQECTADNGEKALEAMQILSRLLDQEERRITNAEICKNKASSRLLRALAAYRGQLKGTKLTDAATLRVGQVLAILAKGERTIQAQQEPRK